MPPVKTAPITPRAFKCPLTGQSFQTPILEADGHTYEKDALDTWNIDHGAISPITRRPLEPFPREPNTTLTRTMREFYEQRTGSASMANEWQKNLECPITYDIMRAPVRLSDGRDYSQQGARDLVTRHGRSPYTEQALHTEWLRPNRTLAALAGEILGTPAAHYPDHTERVGPDTSDAVRAYIDAGLREWDPPGRLQDHALRADFIAEGRRLFEDRAVVFEEACRGLMRLEGAWKGLRMMVGHLPRFSMLPRYMEPYYDANDVLHDLRTLKKMLHVNGAPTHEFERRLGDFEAFLAPRMDAWKRRDAPHLALASPLSAVAVGLAFDCFAPPGSGIMAAMPIPMLAAGVLLGSNMFACALALAERRYPSSFLGEPAPPQVWDVLRRAPQWPKTVIRQAFYTSHAALLGGSYGAVMSVRFADPQKVAPYMAIIGAGMGCTVFCATSALWFCAKYVGEQLLRAAELAAERAA